MTASDMLFLTPKGHRRWREAEEEAIRDMLGKWVSGLEPALVYSPNPDPILLGLTFEGAQPGRRPPIVVRAPPPPPISWLER